MQTEFCYKIVMLTSNNLSSLSKNNRFVKSNWCDYNQ